MRAQLRVLLVLAALMGTSSIEADDVFYWVPFDKLIITDGKLPPPEDSVRSARSWSRRQVIRPFAILDGAGEIYLDTTDPWPLAPDAIRFSVRAEDEKEVTGSFYAPKSDWSGMVKIKFKIPTNLSSVEVRGMLKDQARQMFFGSKHKYYDRLFREGAPGAAWFRHQIRRTLLAMNGRDSDANRASRPSTPDDLFETYSLFTGGRAISENIQLDRLMPPDRGGTDLVDVASIDGITVPEIDWAKLTNDLKPELDPLAKLIPADQHAVFFANFDAFVRVADEARKSGTPVLRLAEPRAEDARTLERYERQLCLSLGGVARLLGPAVVRSVALTGSDANFRTGTDVAILVETADPDALQKLLLAQVALVDSANREVDRAPGEIAGLKYDGVRSPDRKISCYIAELAGAVVLTNSIYQLERLASVGDGKSPTLASLPEYKFFRDRYRRGDKDEAALVFLSDATIRRWCGPRWRIASSRQLRDLAVIAELQATNLDQLVNKKVQPGPIHTDLPFASAGQITLSADGVRSSTTGTLEFLTPIAEMRLEKVTRGEADAYEQWRRGYQTNWRWAFDPIALRFTVEADKLAADLSVMPLIWGSDYARFITVSQGAEIRPGVADPHDDLIHFVLALNTKSPTVRSASNLASTMAPGVNLDPLSWLGQAIALYADDDPAWEELAKTEPDKLENDFPTLAAKLPIALWFEVSSPLKATAFMAAARAYIEQTAPGMTQWESLLYKEQAYVKVTASEQARGAAGELQNMAVYYALSGDSLVLSLSQTVIQHALDRRLERQQKKNGPPAEAVAGQRPWLGANIAARVNRKFLNVLTAVTRHNYQESMQAVAWRSLPILNEWKRLYPDRDPVEIHEQVWKVRLVCPGGGKYVWNDEWQTMESTIYGHPGEPNSGPDTPPALKSLLNGDFGLTFEEQGLRARAVLARESIPTGVAK